MNSKTTIFKDDLPTWKRWCAVQNMNSYELMRARAIIRYAYMKVKSELYKTLTTRDDFKKPLSDCKINKNKVNIRNKGTTLM